MDAEGSNETKENTPTGGNTRRGRQALPAIQLGRCVRCLHQSKVLFTLASRQKLEERSAQLEIAEAGRAEKKGKERGRGNRNVIENCKAYRACIRMFFFVCVLFCLLLIDC